MTDELFEREDDDGGQRYEIQYFQEVNGEWQVYGWTGSLREAVRGATAWHRNPEVSACRVMDRDALPKWEEVFIIKSTEPRNPRLAPIGGVAHD